MYTNFWSPKIATISLFFAQISKDNTQMAPLAVQWVKPGAKVWHQTDDAGLHTYPLL